MTAARHLEFLVEEPSMETFLNGLLPRLLPGDCAFSIHPFQGKQTLLRKLEDRLRGYRKWLPVDWRIVVLVDCDDDGCRALKERLEGAAGWSGLRTRSQAGGDPWQVVNRIAIEGWRRGISATGKRCAVPIRGFRRASPDRCVTATRIPCPV